MSAANSLYRLLDEAVQRCSWRPAVVDGAVTTTYTELAARTRELALVLSAAGVRPGDRVAILLERSTAAVAGIFAVLRAGGVTVVVNDRLRPRQIEHVLLNSGASALLTSREMLALQPRPIASGATVVLVEERGEEEKRGSEGTDDAVERQRGDIAFIVYTSGSTGLPKGVAHTHGGLLSGVSTVAEYLGLTGDDRTASLLPLSSVYGLNQLLCSVATGGALLMERSPLPHQIVTSLAERGVTVIAGVPPLWLQLLGTPAFAEPIPTLRQMQNAGGHLPVDVVRRLRAAQPQARVFLQYGLTEVFRSTFLPPEELDAHPDSMGRAMPGTEILVINEAGRLCEPGEVGEVVHFGPTVAAGYWNDSEATARVFRPHPLDPARPGRAVFSGDMVRRDAEGLHYFVGRADRMIKSLGFRIGPDEIGDVVHASGEVAEVVVVGEPDADRGERIVAHVVLKPEGSRERLMKFCRAELPRHMQPARIQVWEKLARLPSGKYDFAALKGEAAPTS
jgi:amino acid adenylation domain-containing protein